MAVITVSQQPSPGPEQRWSSSSHLPKWEPQAIVMGIELLEHEAHLRILSNDNIQNPWRYALNLPLRVLKQTEQSEFMPLRNDSLAVFLFFSSMLTTRLRDIVSAQSGFMCAKWIVEKRAWWGKTTCTCTTLCSLQLLASCESEELAIVCLAVNEKRVC
jgi:hypothetical protein